MNNKQNNPFTIGLCGESESGKTQFIYQFLTDVIAAYKQSGVPEELSTSTKQYYQALSKEIEQRGLSPTIDEHKLTILLPDNKELNINLKNKVRKLNIFDESGSDFAEFLETGVMAEDGFSQLIEDADVLIYTINPTCPEFTSELYTQTLKEHISQLLKIISKTRGNQYLPVYFLFTHKNDFDSASEKNKNAIQRQIDSLMAFIKQEYQKRYQKTFPRDLASSDKASGLFDLTQPSSGVSVMEKSLNLYGCLEAFDMEFHSRAKNSIYIFLAIAILIVLVAVLPLLYRLVNSSTVPQDDTFQNVIKNLESRIKTQEETLENIKKETSENTNQIGKLNQNISELGKHSVPVPPPQPTPDNNSINKDYVENLVQRLALLEQGKYPVIVKEGVDKIGEFLIVSYKEIKFTFRHCPATTDKGFPIGDGKKQISLSDFWILDCEVTNEMWQEVMGASPIPINSNNESYQELFKKYIPDSTSPVIFNDKLYPVDNVSWNNSIEFCKRLSDKLQKTDSTFKYEFLLPTEAQWEYACRAGNYETKITSQVFDSKIKKRAWYKNNSDGHIHIAKSNKLEPNEWGLYDMCGNVYEYVQDDWGQLENLSNNNPVGKYKDSKDCVYRGGNYKSYARSDVYIGSSTGYADWIYREKKDKSKPESGFGFRICIRRIPSKPVSNAPAIPNKPVKPAPSNTKK